MHNLKIPTQVGRKKWASQRLVRTLMVGVLMGGVCLGHVAPVMAQPPVAAAPAPPPAPAPAPGFIYKGFITHPLPDGGKEIDYSYQNPNTGEYKHVIVITDPPQPAPTGPLPVNPTPEAAEV